MITIASAGVNNLQMYVRRYGDSANTAAQMALNDTVAWSRTRVKKAMQQRITLTESAFNDKRLYVSQYAKRDNLETILSASRQGYSLSRFALTRDPSPEVRVRAGGAAKKVKGGFFISAPNGAQALAIRSKERPRGTRGAKRVKKTTHHSGGKSTVKELDVWILFGPSPYQMARRELPALAPSIAAKLNTEFSRQLVRLTARG